MSQDFKQMGSGNMPRTNNENLELIVYKIDELRKAQDEFRKEFNARLESVAMKSELVAAVHERDSQFDQIERRLGEFALRLDKLENRKSFREIVGYFAAVISLLIAVIALYESFVR